MTLPRDSEIGLDLARDLKIELLDRSPQPDAAAILHCCCWILADVITQAEAVNDVSLVEGLEKTVALLTSYVARLHVANAEAVADAAAVKH